MKKKPSKPNNRTPPTPTRAVALQCKPGKEHKFGKGDKCIYCGVTKKELKNREKKVKSGKI